MIRKRTFIAFLSFLATFCLSSRQSHALTFTEFVYNNAKTNNIKVIQSFLSKGYNIDAIDSNGFTALCYAIEYKDFNAYKNLKALGANSNHSCTQKVAPKTSENYSDVFNSLTTYFQIGGFISFPLLILNSTDGYLHVWKYKAASFCVSKPSW